MLNARKAASSEGRNLSLAGLGDAIEDVGDSIFRDAVPNGGASLASAVSDIGRPDVLSSTMLGSPARQAELLRGYAALAGVEDAGKGLLHQVQEGPGIGHNSSQFGMEPQPEYDPTPRLPLARAGAVVLGALGVASFAPHPSIDQANGIVRKVNNAIGDQLTPRTLDAARRELQGEVVRINPRDGQSFDHITKVRQGQRALLDSILRARNMLNDPSTPGFIRPTVESALSRASRWLDYTERFVPRVHTPRQPQPLPTGP